MLELQLTSWRNAYLVLLVQECARSMKLEISNVVFGNNTLVPGWLDVRANLNSLILRHCRIDTFHDDAFSTPQFANLEELHLGGLTLRKLQAATFRPLRHVKSLALDDCPALQEVDPDLTDVLQELTVLQVLRTISRSNRHVLPAFAGSVSTDAIVDFQFNTLGTLRREDLGAAATSAASLYLSNSGIRDVVVGTFPPSRYRQLLTLSNNKLRTLKNMSISFEHRHPSFAIYLERNPWNCDCSLLWLLPYVSTFADSPLCSAPQHYLNLKMASALEQLKESCTPPPSATVPPSTASETTVSSTTPQPTGTSPGLTSETAADTSDELTIPDDTSELPTTSSESSTHYNTSEVPSTTHSVTETTEWSTTSETTGTSIDLTSETVPDTSDETTVPDDTSELPTTSSESSTHYNTSEVPSTTHSVTETTECSTTSEPTGTSKNSTTETAPDSSDELTVSDDTSKLPTTSSESSTHYNTSEVPSTTHSVTDTTECSTSSEPTGTSKDPTTETAPETSDELTVPDNISEVPTTSSESSTHHTTSVASSTTSAGTDSTSTTEKVPTSVPPDEKPDDLKQCYHVDLPMHNTVDGWSKDSVHIHNVDEFTLKISLPHNVAGGFLVWKSMDSPDCFETSPLISSPVVMEELEPETDYIICVLHPEETRTSIQNCHSHRTMAEYSKLTWISNGDRTFVVSMTILGSCGMVVLSVLVTRLLLWRYPTLIFKEVLEVGKTTVINRRRRPSTRRFSLPYWWPPPPPPPPRRQSSTQSIGSGSYISVPPPSPAQLLAHFLGRSRNSVRRMFRRQEAVDRRNSSFPSSRQQRSESCWSTCPSNYSVSTDSTNTFPSEDLTNTEDIYTVRQ